MSRGEDTPNGPDAATTSPLDDGGVVEQIDFTCAAPSRCVTPPPGWDGPFIVELPNQGSTATLVCPPEFVRAWERSQTADAAAPPATCSCACGPFTGACAVTVTDYQDNRCMQGAAPHVLAPATCVPTDGGPASFRASAAVQGACPPNATVTVSPLDASPIAIGCAPSQPGGCDSGVCFPPSPAGSRRCLRPTNDGDGGSVPSCPADFPVALALNAGTEDTRGCSTCTCAATGTCNFTYGLYTSATCGGSSRAQHSDTFCHSPPGISGERLTSVAVTGSCVASGGTPIGGLVLRTAATLCCTK